MVQNQAWMRLYKDLAIELCQSRDEGKDVSAFGEAIEKIQSLPEEAAREREALALYARLQALPVRADYPYSEPSDLEAIFAQRPETRWAAKKRLNAADLYDRIYGAWLARCAGCLLGQPIEGWRSARIRGFLEATGNLPVTGYLSSAVPEAIRAEYGVVDEGRVYGSHTINWINHVTCMPEDDDTNYTVVGLKLVEEFGRDFQPGDVAIGWLSFLPLLHTCTAERVAYRNLAACLEPPASALHANPYREWIGAQIRADFFGYINPYDIETAARMAFADASISHIKNGIYGEMFFASVISAAFTAETLEEAIRAGLTQLPQRSRLAEALRDVLDGYARDEGYAAALRRVTERFDENQPHDWCHTIPNAMIVLIALLYGAGDLEKTLGYAILPGFDTDCNGATAGSVLGAFVGAQRLPEKWIAPLHDALISGVDGFGHVAISELARRTVALCGAGRE